jgi:hypothetical protein
MNTSKTLRDGTLVLCGIFLLSGSAAADEGMWPFQGVPAETIQKAYGFTPSQKWLDDLRLASVRLNDGGSGSFVSSEGLLLTNHHVALGQIQKASNRSGKDYVKDGFYAHAPAEEFKCDDLEVNVLESMDDVTARVTAAVKPGASEAEADEQRKAEMSRIEKQSLESTGLRSNVISLYAGGQYWLYRYKKFTDVRLVMAPESQAANFGGDPDNFTYPRYALDFAFFRVYEDGKPYRPKHYLPWSRTGLRENEPSFVSGHPGSTARLKTLAQLQTIKELEAPAMFDGLGRTRAALLAYGAQGAEQKRQVMSRVQSIENSLKATEGRLAALNNPAFMATKASQQKALRDAVDKDPILRAQYSAAWEDIAKAESSYSGRFKEFMYRRTGGTLAGLANTLVTYVDQLAKPNEKRWEEYRESSLPSLTQRLYSPATLYPGMEKAMLTVGLQTALEKLGPDDTFVKTILQGKTIAEVVEEAVSKTKLFDVEYRKQLVAGGKQAIDASEDPLIRMARQAAPILWEMRTWKEKTVEAVETTAGTKISKARFAVHGNSIYPDANFTLRLSYGKAAGYQEDTTRVPYKTTFYGLYGRAADFDNKEPYDLAAKIAAARGAMDLATPINFVTTNDIIGGNSGSPVVNKDGELVGLIFDGNIQSLEGDYLYRDAQNRSVAVHSAGIMEALTKIYGMGDLASELTRGAMKAVTNPQPGS